MPNPVNRRFFIKLSVMGLAAAPLGHLLMGGPAQAQMTRSGRYDPPKQIPKVDMDVLCFRRNRNFPGRFIVVNRLWE